MIRNLANLRRQFRKFNIKSGRAPGCYVFIFADFYINSVLKISLPRYLAQYSIPGSIRMILTVTNPDAMFAPALQAGATEIFPVGEEYGWRLGRLVDPFGLHWEIGRQLDIFNE